LLGPSLYTCRRTIGRLRPRRKIQEIHKNAKNAGNKKYTFFNGSLKKILGLPSNKPSNRDVRVTVALDVIPAQRRGGGGHRRRDLRRQRGREREREGETEREREREREREQRERRRKADPNTDPRTKWV